jgi:hypothetical protein
MYSPTAVPLNAITWGTVVESPSRAVSMNQDDFLVGRTKVNWTTNCYLNCKFVICTLQLEFLIILSMLTDTNPMRMNTHTRTQRVWCCKATAFSIDCIHYIKELHAVLQGNEKTC